MDPRSAKRNYSGSALEAWFRRVGSPWEGQFAGAVLEEGRRLYRERQVRELELTDDLVIVHTKVDRQPVYALVEWRDGHLEVRSSVADRRLGEVLAVAGLYEVEELVADEVSPLPEDTPVSVAPESREEGSEAVQASEAVERPSRSLVVQFSADGQSIRLGAAWEGVTEGRVEAWAAEPGGGPELTSGEREKLIRLSALAHQAGFEFRPREHDYQLRDLSRAPELFRHTLPGWKRHFLVEIDARLAGLGRGPAAARSEIGVEEAPGGSGIRLRWRLRVGESWLDEVVSGKILRAGGRGYLVPGHGLVEVNPAEIDAFEDWVGNAAGASLEQLPRYMLFSLLAQKHLNLRMSPQLQAWRREWMDRDWDTDHPELRPDFPQVLRPYQVRGVEWMARVLGSGGHPLLADEMGLGKTVQVATLMLRRLPVEGLPSLVVCPASVVPVWQSEIERFFAGTEVAVVRGGRVFGQEGVQPRVWISSYTQIRRHKHLLGKAEFGYAVLDEAQFIKNPEAKVTMACNAIRARYRVALTGTPLENRLLDLWTLFRFLMPGLLGSRASFERRFDPEAGPLDPALNRQIAPFLLRRTKRDVAAELPPKVETALVCPLTEVQEREYRRLADSGLSVLGEDFQAALKERPLSLLTLLTRLRQTACDPHLLPWHTLEETVHSGKLNALRERLLEIVQGGGKVVLFSQFVSFLHRARKVIMEDFPDLPLFELTGKVVDREAPVKGFQEAQGPAAILVSLKAGGTGVTLHAADYVFLLDPWWNPAVEAQAIDRVHRLGQRRTVFVYRMVTRGTIEERIERLKSAKRGLFDEVVGSLSGQDSVVRHFQSLRSLIALEPDA